METPKFVEREDVDIQKAPYMQPYCDAVGELTRRNAYSKSEVAQLIAEAYVRGYKDGQKSMSSIRNLISALDLEDES